MAEDAVERAGARSLRGSYGFDAAYVPLGLAASGAADAAVAWWAMRRRRRITASVTAFGVVRCLATAADFTYSTRRGKFEVWRSVLDDLRLRGNERVLDIGCGRGAVLVSVAGRLPYGRAVGVDIWRARGQSGNGRAAAEDNAEVEGVADRVELIDADARALPFPDASFDVVVSSLAIHNISGSGGRDTAIGEMVRVLGPAAGCG